MRLFCWLGWHARPTFESGAEGVTARCPRCAKKLGFMPRTDFQDLIRREVREALRGSSDKQDTKS